MQVTASIHTYKKTMKQIIQKKLGDIFDKYVFPKTNTLLTKEYGEDWNDDK
tara:strand:+ start:2995 stop:3147 length:153 start_codon:yes stop_codon:yes gene_type:complete